MNENSGATQATPLFISDQDIQDLTEWQCVIEALHHAYSQPESAASTPERAIAVTSHGWQRVMPSAPPGAKFGGSKTIAASTRNGMVSYLVTLFDQQTSRLTALLDGNRITGLRTAGTAAAALTKLLPKRPLTVAVVGSGFEARAQLRATALIAEIDEVRVSSPTQANREAFASELSRELNLPITAVPTAEDAVRGADLILCAARSRDETPTVLANWVADDATIVSIGSTTPTQRELDPALLARASFIVADALAEVLHDSGDMIAARNAGFDPDKTTVSLHSLLGGHVKRPEHGIAVYKSTGSGFQDIVLAEMFYERAVSQGRGTPLPVEILTLRK